MTFPPRPRLLVFGTAVLVVAATSAAAQDARPASTRRVAVDTVFGYLDYPSASANSPAQFIFDTFASTEVHRQWQVSFRSKVWRVGGDWHVFFDQIAVQTEFHKGSDWRIEVGRFPVPIGLGMTENRANLNAGMMWCHRPYYMPLPTIGADVPRVSLSAAVYPTGAQVMTSARHWDARAALVDLAPVQFWYEPVRASNRPNVILAGGVTPWQGFRIGAGAATGRFAAPTASRGGLQYVMANVEADYAFAYTRISGEWTRDRFETAVGDRVSRGVTLQVQQTLTPRLFVHSRMTLIESPQVAGTPVTATQRTYRSVDTTVGYRVTPEFTFRVGHSAVRSWTSGAFGQEMGLSLIWARRWW